MSSFDKYAPDEINFSDEDIAFLESTVPSILNKLFGLQFSLAEDIEGYHPEVDVYRVLDRDQNLKAVELFHTLNHKSIHQ